MQAGAAEAGAEALECAAPASPPAAVGRAGWVRWTPVWASGGCRTEPKGTLLPRQEPLKLFQCINEIITLISSTAQDSFSSYLQ